MTAGVKPYKLVKVLYFIKAFSINILGLLLIYSMLTCISGFPQIVSYTGKTSKASCRFCSPQTDSSGDVSDAPIRMLKHLLGTLSLNRTLYIVQKLVEQFLKGIDASLKRDLYYWHAYYVSSTLSSLLLWFRDK